MIHTGASLNMKNSIEKHDLATLTLVLVFTCMSNSRNRKSSSSY